MPDEKRSSTFSVLLVIFSDSDYGWLGIGYLSAALKRNAGVDVTVSYYRSYQVEQASIEAVNRAPDLLGLPLLQDTLAPVKAFLAMTKPQIPLTHFTLGNKEVTGHPRLIAEWCPDADSVVIGEAEQTVVELVERLWAGDTLKDCAGVWYRDSGELIENRLRPVESNLDLIPFPNRSVLPTDNVAIAATEAHKVFPVLTSRGCTARCTFCEVGGTKPSQMRARSMENVTEEIWQLLQEHDATYILFSDDSFEDGHPIEHARFHELADAIIARGLNLRFFMMCKANALITPGAVDALENLKASGLDRLFIGFESGNAAELKLYGKKAKVHDNDKALELLNELNITVSPGFIMFNPYSTFDKLRENVAFLERHKLMAYSHVFRNRFHLFNGVALAKKVVRDGLVTEGLSMPYENPFSYRFSDDRIGEVWCAVDAIGEIPMTEDEFLSTRSFANLLYSSNSPYQNDRIVYGLTIMLEEYVLLSNRLFTGLLENIFQLAEQGAVDIADKLKPEYEYIATTLHRSWMDIRKVKFLLVKVLAEQSMIPLLNFPACRKSPASDRVIARSRH